MNTTAQSETARQLPWVSPPPSIGITNWDANRGIPEPHRQITAEDFLGRICDDSYGLYGTAYRTVRDEDGRTLTCKLYWFRDFGLALVYHTVFEDWRTKAYPPPRVGHTRLVNTGPRDCYQHDARFYLLGCQHEYREISAARCEELGLSARPGGTFHVAYCEKCGAVHSYDSSD